MDLDVRHLRVVLAVADHGSFTAAAVALRVSQSSLSRTVLDIERRLGTALFERTTRSVLTTRDGAELVTLARRVVAEFDGALEHFSGYLAGTRGTVSVAALPSLAATLLPAVLVAFRERQPGVSVVVRDGLSREVLDRVEQGEVDFALTVAPVVPPRLRATPVARDRFFCVFAPGHHFDVRRRLTWRDLADEPFVAFDATSSIRALTDRTLAEQEILPGPTTEARNIGAVAGLVGAGLGVSAVPGFVLPMMRFAGVHRRAIDEPVVERDTCLVWDPRRPLAPAAAALVELLATARRAGISLPAGTTWAAVHHD